MSSEMVKVSVVVVTTDSVVSFRILRRLLTDARIECQTLVLLSSAGTEALPTVVRRVLKRSGWRMLGYKAVGHLASELQTLATRVRGEVPSSPAALARSRGVRVLEAADCNDPDVVEVLGHLGPDLLVSVNVY